MRITAKGDDKFEARFSQPDWECFQQILSLYPCVPAAHHKLRRDQASVASAQDAAAQALLEESLAEHRAANKKALLGLLSDPTRLTQTDRHHVLVLSMGELMFLLQVFNDVRVGSWLELGSPEELHEPKEASKKRLYFSMELAGYYESRIIDTVGGSA